VADVITAKEEQDINDMLSGISMDGSAKELQEMRDMRQQMKAGARISREMAGTDTKRQEAEFMEYARSNTGNAEFEKLIGLAQATDAGTSESHTPDKPSRVSES
jgi:phage shock protein A